jgi:ABC-type multidrug transport system permease subunit
LTVRGAEAAQSAGFVMVFPLVFASSVFVPVSSMPDWLQAFAEASPITLTANAARSFALTGGVPGSLGAGLPGLLGSWPCSSALRLALPAHELGTRGDGR